MKRCGALRELHFVDGLEPLDPYLPRSADDRVRLAALESIVRIAKDNSPAAALVLLEAVAPGDAGRCATAAEALLAMLSGDEMVTLIRQARDAEVGDRREIFERVLRAVH